MPNIHTISSSRDEDSKKDKEQLVGGGATSSTAVFRGNQPGNSGNPMDALVNKVRLQVCFYLFSLLTRHTIVYLLRYMF